MNKAKIQQIIGIIAMLFSVYMFFDKRGGLGFFVLLIGAVVFGLGKKEENENQNYVPRQEFLKDFPYWEVFLYINGGENYG